MEALVRTARRLVAPHQVVLGLDTAPDVLAARLRAAGIMPTAATAAAYRRMVLGADLLATHVSGIVVRPTPWHAAGVIDRLGCGPTADVSCL